jgi:RNA polymerase sigma-70 factor (ECF subfamily)
VEQDLDLVRRCLGGENLAWEELLRLHTRRVYNLCYRFTGRPSEAEDLTQEVFIKIFQTLRTYDPRQGSFSTWLHRVARNHLVDHYRRTRKDRLTSPLEDELPRLEEVQTAVHDDPAGRVESRERQELVQRALEKLSPDMREAVILRDFQELDYEEISQILGIPLGTVKSRINRGRLELARVIQRMEKMRVPGRQSESDDAPRS